MTRQITLLVSGSLVMFSTLSVAETLTVTVLNEQNKGIRSRVIYKTGPVPAVLGDTNADGALTKDFSCTSGEVLSAKPFDKGSYFESTGEPCQSKVTLRVLGRQNPKGFAVNYRIEKIDLPDGSPAVIAYKGFVNTTAAASGNSACAVDVSSKVQQQVYKVEGGTWTPVQSNEIDPSTLFFDVTTSFDKPVLLPYTCNASSSRIQMLNADAAGVLSGRLASGKLSVSNSLQSLGLK